MLAFDVAKTRYADKPQVPTDWHHANTLSIDSLEWMASDSDVIARGTIEDLVMVQKGDYVSRKNYDVTLDLHLLKLHVDETLKGEVADTISLLIANGGRLSQWQKKRTPLVLFSKDWALQIEGSPKRLVGVARDHQPPVVRYAGRGADTKAIVALDTDHPKVYSASDGWIDDPQKMLAIVRNYLTQEPSGRESRSLEHIRLVSFKPPTTFLEGTPWENDPYVRMKFPIDAYLEKQARRWLTSDRKEQRWLGADCLVYFKSDANTKALRKLLNDPGKWPEPVEDVKDARQKVTYLVRREAWTILNAWGCDVPKPLFDD